MPGGRVSREVSESAGGKAMRLSPALRLVSIKPRNDLISPVPEQPAPARLMVATSMIVVYERFTS